MTRHSANRFILNGKQPPRLLRGVRTPTQVTDPVRPRPLSLPGLVVARDLRQLRHRRDLGGTYGLPDSRSQSME